MKGDKQMNYYIRENDKDCKGAEDASERKARHTKKCNEEIIAKASKKKEVTKEEIDEVLGEYALNQNEYLVDGAILSCDKAIRSKIVLDINSISHQFDCPQLSSMDDTQLHVEENGREINGLYMATVKDTVLNKNISPFQRNCSLLPDKQEEIDKIIKSMPSCKSNGICQALIDLSDEWENLPSDTDYLSYTDRDDKGGSGEEKQGINMMSMLFCKHGGLITPKTSGQRKMKCSSEYQNFYILDKDGNFISYGEISRYPLKYIEFLKAYETHEKVGNMHVLSNGGKTIAYGHDLLAGENFSSGLNEYQAINLLMRDLDSKYDMIINKVNQLNSNYGYQIDVNDFSEEEKLFLVDFAFNRGSGLVNRSQLKQQNKPSSSIAI